MPNVTERSYQGLVRLASRLHRSAVAGLAGILLAAPAWCATMQSVEFTSLPGDRTEIRMNFKMSDEREIVPVDIRLGTLQATSPRDVVQQASDVAGVLAKVVNDRKLYTNISGRKYVRVQGWNTLGAMLGIVPRETEVIRFEDGSYQATVELIRVSDGAIIGRGSAIVGMDEPTWSKRAEYARRSMAITRATGKAFRLGFSWIMTLAGYEPTPAEEMVDVIDSHATEIPPEGNGQMTLLSSFT